MKYPVPEGEEAAEISLDGTCRGLELGEVLRRGRFTLYIYDLLAIYHSVAAFTYKFQLKISMLRQTEALLCGSRG
jgi:hypothetical protein